MNLELLFLIITVPLLSISLYIYSIYIKESNRINLKKLRLEQIKFINDPEIDEALSKILWEWEWDDYDDYWNKYSPKNNSEANVIRRVARNYYVALAIMVKNGDLDIELLYELNPSGVTRYWEKIKPIAIEFRKRNNYPDYLAPVDYLAGRIDEFRERKKIPTPKQVT